MNCKLREILINVISLSSIEIHCSRVGNVWFGRGARHVLFRRSEICSQRSGCQELHVRPFFCVDYCQVFLTVLSKTKLMTYKTWFELFQGG